MPSDDPTDDAIDDPAEDALDEPTDEPGDTAAEGGDDGFGDLDPDRLIGEVNALGIVEREDDRLLYDCTTWSGESRSLLDAMLGSAGVTHTWQGTVVGVPVDAEEEVDAIIDQVLAAATAALDPGADKVAYEVGTWSASLQSMLAEALTVADIPYEWDVNGDLVIYADDEERAEEIFDTLPDPDDPELSSEDGVAVQDLLSQMFVAAGHLAKKPTDADAVVSLVDTTDQAERLSLPFGFEPAVWKNLVGLAANLRDALTEEDEDAQLSDDELRDRAAALKVTLRQYV